MWLLGLCSSTLGLFIGGSIAWLFKRQQQKIDIIYAICAGNIFGLISIEILPEAIEIGGWFISLIGFLIGIITFVFLHDILHNNHKLKRISKKKLYIRTGLLLMASIFIHNLPMGIILGASKEYDFSVTLLQTILFHSIPEGIILFTPFFLAGINLVMLLFISLIISIPVAIGVYIGNHIWLDLQIFTSSVISFTVGFLLMVTVMEILIPSLKKSSALTILFNTMVGFVLMGLYILFF